MCHNANGDLTKYARRYIRLLAGKPAVAITLAYAARIRRRVTFTPRSNRQPVIRIKPELIKE